MGLSSGLGEELDAGGLHALVAGLEIIDTEEESDATGVLVADRRDLVFAVGAGEEDAGLCARGRTTTQRLGRPSFVLAGESSTSSNPKARVKKAIASS